MELKREIQLHARQVSVGFVLDLRLPNSFDDHLNPVNLTRTYCTNQIEEQGPDDILRGFWELEAIGIRDKTERDLTPDEKAAEAQVAETLHLRNGRYEIGIPWKRGEPHLVNNYEMALNRLKTQERSLVRRGPEVANTYDEIIKDYERKGYVKKVPKSNEPEQWFLPHFPVIRHDRTTTKVRIVFDAATKDNGKCCDLVRNFKES
jgi:hypothetical protein